MSRQAPDGGFKQVARLFDKTDDDFTQAAEQQEGVEKYQRVLFIGFIYAAQTDFLQQLRHERIRQRFLEADAGDRKFQAVHRTVAGVAAEGGAFFQHQNPAIGRFAGRGQTGDAAADDHHVILAVQRGGYRAACRRRGRGKVARGERARLGFAVVLLTQHVQRRQRENRIEQHDLRLGAVQDRDKSRHHQQLAVDDQWRPTRVEHQDRTGGKQRHADQRVNHCTLRRQPSRRPGVPGALVRHGRLLQNIGDVFQLREGFRQAGQHIEHGKNALNDHHAPPRRPSLRATISFCISLVPEKIRLGITFSKWRTRPSS